MVRRYQGDDLTHDSAVMACVKHFALYGAAEAGREYNTVDMSQIAMYQNYLPPYRAAVDAGVGSVITSFNDIDSVPASANRCLLKDVLRDQWQFTGFVVSDYRSINEMMQHGLGTLQEVNARAINAGVDMDMVGEGFLQTLETSMQEGKVSEAIIDTACRRILEAKDKLGLFDDPFRYCNKSREKIEQLTVGNRQLAKNLAFRSFVLLKNDRQILPLVRFNSTIALVGPLANDRRNVIGNWTAAGDWYLAVSVLDGINNLVDIFSFRLNIRLDDIFD